MLQCGKNFGGTIGGMCGECSTYDDENHRMNHRKKWKHINHFDHVEKIDFNQVYSQNVETLRDIVKELQKVWNTRNTPGMMNSS